LDNLVIVRTVKLVSRSPEESAQFDVTQLNQTITLGQMIKGVVGKESVGLFTSPHADARKMTHILHNEFLVDSKSIAALYSGLSTRPNLTEISALIKTNEVRFSTLVLVTHRDICTVLPVLYARLFRISHLTQEVPPGHACVISMQKRKITLLDPRTG